LRASCSSLNLIDWSTLRPVCADLDATGTKAAAPAQAFLLHPPPTSTPKIGHHDFLLHNNEPPTYLRTYPPAHPAYGLCSDSFKHLERWLFDSFGLHRAAQGVRLCVQLNDQPVRPGRARLIGSDRCGRLVRAGGAWWHVQVGAGWCKVFATVADVSECWRQWKWRVSYIKSGGGAGNLHFGGTLHVLPPR